MEFPTDAKFSNVGLKPSANQSSLLYVSVKNMYSEFGSTVTLNSVFDKNPNVTGSHYRKEPLLRLSREDVWEINPYFLDSDFISTENTGALPTLLASGGPFITGRFELSDSGLASDSFSVSLSKPHNSTITFNVVTSPESTYINVTSPITFEPGEVGPKPVTITQKNGLDLASFSDISTTTITFSETTSEGLEDFLVDITVTYEASSRDPGAYVTFTDNFSSTNFEDVNSALVPAIINNFAGFKNQDIMYVLYNGSELGLETAVTDGEGNSWKIISKDLISVEGSFAYVLMQIRGITVLTSGGRLPLSKLRFVVLRNGAFYNLTSMTNAGGLTSYLSVNGISANFEENLFNGTIEMGNVQYFYRFKNVLEPSAFALASAGSALRVMRNSVAKAPVSKNALLGKTMHNLIDNNVYTTQMIDSWMLFDENNYANPIAFYSTVKMGGNYIIAPGDMLAAYIVDSLGNSEIRGISSTDYATSSGSGVIPWTYAGESVSANILETTVFTSALESTEFLKFRLFKKQPFVLNGVTLLEGDTVYELSQELPVGGIKGIAGGMYSEGPNSANIFYIGRFTTVLNGPFDDFSFNVTLDSMTKENIFVNGSTSQLSNIKAYRSQDYTAVQVAPNVWISNTMSDGSLFAYSQLSFKEFYSVRLNDGITTLDINIDGFPVKTTTVINLSPGYNWVGYTMFRPETLANTFLLSGNTRLDPASSLKAIITRDQGSSLVSNGGFFGSLSQMRPGGAYVLYIDPSLANDSLITLTYPSTYNTATIQPPSGYFAVDSFVDPLNGVLINPYVYISNTEFGICFEDSNNPGSYVGIKSTGSYTTFGVHDTTMSLVSPQTISVGNLGSFIPSFEGLDGILTSIQLKAGFTATDGRNIDGANGVLDFIIRKLPDQYGFSDTEIVDYKLSEIGGLLSSSPPFTFRATFGNQSSVPAGVADFFGTFPTTVIPVSPQTPSVITLSTVDASTIRVELDLLKLPGSSTTSIFSTIEIFIDGIDFGTVDESVTNSDNVTHSPAGLTSTILLAQGNAIQFLNTDGVAFGDYPIIIFEATYVSAQAQISLGTDSFIADLNGNTYVIPDFLP